MTETTATTQKTATASATKASLSRKNIKKMGRQKRIQKLTADAEYRKAYFTGKSKRSAERKSAFRKKKKGK